MILVDHQIQNAIAEDRLFIGDFDIASLQPASYDLRIGRHIYSPPQPETPVDLGADGGGYRLPPYGNAVLETHEDLRLPKNILGRIGLKSGFARLGLMASTGPQIDPGFEGKLFVSLFNVTAVPHVLKFKDTFLTIEFHALGEEPTEAYQGPYQGKYTVGAEVLDSMVRLEGLTLSQMQQQFSELAQHVKAWSTFAGRIDEFLSDMKAYTQTIAELTRRLGAQPTAPALVQAVEARTVTVETAVEEIARLFRQNKQLYYSDIAERLGIDFGTVIAAVDELRKRGVIEEAGTNEP
ncbi:MAG: hypothetical protein E6J20_21065 [Chloroflexi bacterium]|nr:MAG: hypothetical protein E6J20_21065 [Chloroflexota bacterium]